MPISSIKTKPIFWIVGVIFAAIGLILLGGGIWLAALGGSLYYVIIGVVLIITAILVIRGNMAGVWLYFGAFLGTLIWALWEVGLNIWPLVPRLTGPFVLLLVIIAISPYMSASPIGKKAAFGGIVVAIVAMVGGIFLITGEEKSSDPNRIVQNDISAINSRFIASGGDWTDYGGSGGAQRYSRLDQINTGNVKNLERAWVAHTKDLPDNMGENSYGAETTPIKIGDTVYLCSATNIIIALDPSTGREKWRYDPEVSDENIPYTAACRGVTYYETPDADPNTACAARIIEGTLDARLIAVDAQTGLPCSDFGQNGAVDITAGMGEVVPGMVSITSPPVIVQGVIVTGHQVLDGQKLDAPSGAIRGYDVITGDLEWAWDMARPDLTGMPEEGDSYTRGTPNMWTTASGDEELGLVYLPMGNAAGDYLSSSRTAAENEYSTALVAIDVTSGKPAWHFQTVLKDVWDYDLGSTASLVDLPSGEGSIPALILSSKQGDIFVLNRQTGELLSKAEKRPAPSGGVEPAERSPVQIYSLYHQLDKPPLTERDMWGMTPIDQMVCRIQFRKAAYKGKYTPPTAEQRWIEYPGYNGGSDWGGVAIDPVRGLIIANYNDMPNYNRLVPREEADRKGWAPRGDARGGDMGGGAEGAGDPQAGAPYAIDVNAGWRLPFTGLLCKQPPYGGIRAIDISSGKTVWDRPLGTARNNGPFGIPSMLPFTIGTPNNGGSVVTAGNLVFIAAATDNLFRAIDIRTGETLWQDVLPAGGQANPMTYESGGKQYVLIMAGGHHFMETPIGDELIAYALPD